MLNAIHMATGPLSRYASLVDKILSHILYSLLTDITKTNTMTRIALKKSFFSISPTFNQQLDKGRLT